MEQRFAFFIDGEILIIERDEGESTPQFTERLKFIFDRIHIYIADVKSNSKESLEVLEMLKVQ